MADATDCGTKAKGAIIDCERPRDEAGGGPAVIAGRTRFYVVAGIVGAIVGEALAGALVIGASRLLSQDTALVLLALLLMSGTAGGAFAGVALMRGWYRREVEKKHLIAR